MLAITHAQTIITQVITPTCCHILLRPLLAEFVTLKHIHFIKLKHTQFRQSQHQVSTYPRFQNFILLFYFILHFILYYYFFFINDVAL